MSTAANLQLPLRRRWCNISWCNISKTGSAMAHALRQAQRDMEASSARLREKDQARIRALEQQLPSRAEDEARQAQVTQLQAASSMHSNDCRGAQRMKIEESVSCRLVIDWNIGTLDGFYSG
jgi:hypothetical protein